MDRAPVSLQGAFGDSEAEAVATGLPIAAGIQPGKGLKHRFVHVIRNKSQKSGTRILIAELQFQPLKTLARARVNPVPGVSAFYPTLADALAETPEMERDDG